MRIGLLDIGGTAVKYALWSDGTLVSRGRIETFGERGAGDVLLRAGDVLETLLPFDAVGVSTRGQITREGVVYFDTEDIRNWTGTAVGSFFSERFGVPTAVENDANCMALGESVSGAGRQYDSVLCAAFGTGVGGGLVLNGRLWRGTHGFAGEIGLMPYAEGVWEERASVSALLALAQERDPRLTDGFVLSSHLGEDAAEQALSLWLRDVGAGLRGLVYTFDPGAVVLGGGLMSNPFIARRVAEAVADGLVPGFSPAVVPASLGGDAMLLGAAAAAQEELHFSKKNC